MLSEINTELSVEVYVLFEIGTDKFWIIIRAVHIFKNKIMFAPSVILLASIFRFFSVKSFILLYSGIGLHSAVFKYLTSFLHSYMIRI